MISLFKKLFLVIVIIYIDRNIFSLLSEYFLIFPITFLAFTFYAYKSDKNLGAFESFSIGIFVDLISDTYFGLNAIIFCITTYFINLNSNAFKLFSYLQICLFFGLSAAAYVGFSQLILNIYDFSYLTLFLSLVSNIVLCFLIAFISSYFPKKINMRI